MITHIPSTENKLRRVKLCPDLKVIGPLVQKVFVAEILQTSSRQA